MSHEATRLLNFDFDPVKNYEDWSSAPPYAGVHPSEYFTNYSALAPLVHGTSLPNLYSILDSGSVKSYASLEKIGHNAVSDSMLTQTDELDIKLGLHNFTFWDLGRGHAETGQYGAYLLADNALLDEGLASFLEIANLGALVSPEAMAQYRYGLGFSEAQIERRNKQATDRYFEGLFLGSDFRNAFAKYLTAYHRNATSFFTMWHHHESDRSQDGLVTIHKDTMKESIRSSWQGPQLIVPGEVPLERVNTLLLADFNGVRITQDEVARIKRMSRRWGIKVVKFTEVIDSHLSLGSLDGIGHAVRFGPPKTSIHSSLNFALNTISGAIENAEQEAKRIDAQLRAAD